MNERFDVLLGAAASLALTLALAVYVGRARSPPAVDRSTARWLHENRIDALDPARRGARRGQRRPRGGGPRELCPHVATPGQAVARVSRRVLHGDRGPVLEPSRSWSIVPPSALPPARHRGEPGYPCGLAGLAIGIEARIVSVCDAWAAMRAERPYRAAVSETEAIEELHRAAGHQFDPDVVEAFLAVLHRDEGLSRAQALSTSFR